MKYYTGTVNSFDDLETIIKSACTQDLGWSLSGNVLYKNGCYFELLAENSSYLPYRRLKIRGGTGESSGALTGAYAQGAAIVEVNPHTIAWPATYHIHGFTESNDGADEVYVVLEYNVEYYQTIAFGKSTVADIGGTGAWFTASGSTGANRTDRDRGYVYNSSDTVDDAGFLTGPSYADVGFIGGLFWTQGTGSGYQSAGVGAIHHAVDGGAAWWHGASSIRYIAGLLTAIPPVLNDAHMLLPIRVVLPRSENRLAVIQQHKFARWTRNDHIEPGDIISFGSDKWKVYPYWRRNGAVRNPPRGNQTHTGTYAFALKYPSV